MVYIQRKDGKNLETIDQFKTMKEARLMLLEYRISDNTANYYISSRACEAWHTATIEKGQHVINKN